ncbi:uncharacterized protein LOC128746456 [Sabethes cyaneus]|uniref:uncharacterized protein LOC128746456 n=1 Tax=Sabethes cyaneus TaxID=53552 RepID=UPI00237E1240|nr:uncharacterized protein LOC128746456 [Sabethes cyaneus]
MWKTVGFWFLIFCAVSAASRLYREPPDPELQLVRAVSRTIVRYGSIISDRFRSPLLVDSFAQDRRARHQQQDCLDGVLRSVEREFPVQFHCHTKPSHHERAVMLSLILIDGRIALRKFLNHMDERFDTSGIFWIVLFDPNSSEKFSNQYELLQHILENFWHKQILYVFIFVISESNGVQLYSFFPYDQNVCGFVQPVLLDWQKDRLFRSRLPQLYGCPLRIGTFENPPFIMIAKDAQGHAYLRGIEGNLINTISKRLNFTLTIVSPPENDQWGQLGEDGNNTGLMKLLLDGSVDFGISSLGLTEKRMTLLSPGTFHFTTDLIFAVPSGRQYSAFEKLFLPLSAGTWYVVCGFLVGALITIAFVKVQKSRVQDFVFGLNIRTPTLNLLSVLFGGSSVRCPTRNFARTLLMLWTLCTLVVRTAYQGSLYKYLQAPKNFSAPSTIDAIQREGLYFYMLDIDLQYFVNYPRVFDRIRFFSHQYSATVEKMEQIGREELDGALLTLVDSVAFHNQVYPPEDFIQITREVVCTFPMVIYYPKHSLLKRIFDQEIKKLRTTGLMQLWASRYGNYDFLRRTKMTALTKPLSVGHLAGAFELYGVLLTLSGIVFLVEVIAKRSGQVGIAVERIQYPEGGAIACYFSCGKPIRC